MANPRIQAIKGTRDFYPEDMAIRSWLYKIIRKVSESFGFQEWEGPLLESYDLYVAKSGEDLVKENFVFPDRGGDLISLRPELTPTLARMVAQRQKSLTYPLRWWSFGPFWRYERPQKGRAREFFQWNIDIIGEQSAVLDAELVAVGATFLKEVGLTPDQVQILVNNRRLVETELENLAITPKQRIPVFRLIDRREKMPFDEWKAYASDIDLDEYQFQGIQNLLEDQNLWTKSDELIKFFETIELFGLRNWVKFDPNIIRGLDYYTGTVFEAWDKAGEFRAILGGGRYDNLIQDIGGDPLPGVGFAMGDLITTLFLQKYDCLRKIKANSAQVLVTIFDKSTSQKSISLAANLRNLGLNVICYHQPAKLAKQLKYGDRIGVRFAVIQGPDEITQGNATIKNLQTSEQFTAPEATIVETIKIKLSELEE
jgi:histidyl-tRNA synthetase